MYNIMFSYNMVYRDLLLFTRFFIYSVYYTNRSSSWQRFREKKIPEFIRADSSLFANHFRVTRRDSCGKRTVIRTKIIPIIGFVETIRYWSIINSSIIIFLASATDRGPNDVRCVCYSLPDARIFKRCTQYALSAAFALLLNDNFDNKQRHAIECLLKSLL